MCSEVTYLEQFRLGRLARQRRLEQRRAIRLAMSELESAMECGENNSVDNAMSRAMGYLSSVWSPL